MVGIQGRQEALRIPGVAGSLGGKECEARHVQLIPQAEDIDGAGAPPVNEEQRGVSRSQRLPGNEQVLSGMGVLPGLGWRGQATSQAGAEIGWSTASISER